MVRKPEVRTADSSRHIHETLKAVTYAKAGVNQNLICFCKY